MRKLLNRGEQSAKEIVSYEMIFTIANWIYDAHKCTSDGSRETQ